MSGGSNLYHRLRTVCNSWPINIKKDGRDFGQYLRKKLISVCKEGEKTKLDEQYWEPRIAALERLQNDYHHKEFYAEFKSASAVEDLEEIEFYASNEPQINPVETTRQNILKQLDLLDSEKKTKE